MAASVSSQLKSEASRLLAKAQELDTGLSRLGSEEAAGKAEELLELDRTFQTIQLRFNDSEADFDELFALAERINNALQSANLKVDAAQMSLIGRISSSLPPIADERLEDLQSTYQRIALTQNNTELASLKGRVELFLRKPRLSEMEQILAAILVRNIEAILSATPALPVSSSRMTPEETSSFTRWNSRREQALRDVTHKRGTGNYEGAFSLLIFYVLGAANLGREFHSAEGRAAIERHLSQDKALLKEIVEQQRTREAAAQRDLSTPLARLRDGLERGDNYAMNKAYKELSPEEKQSLYRKLLVEKVKAYGADGLNPGKHMGATDFTLIPGSPEQKKAAVMKMDPPASPAVRTSSVESIAQTLEARLRETESLQLAPATVVEPARQFSSSSSSSAPSLNAQKAQEARSSHSLDSTPLFRLYAAVEQNEESAMNAAYKELSSGEKQNLFRKLAAEKIKLGGADGLSPAKHMGQSPFTAIPGTLEQKKAAVFKTFPEGTAPLPSQRSSSAESLLQTFRKFHELYAACENHDELILKMKEFDTLMNPSGGNTCSLPYHLLKAIHQNESPEKVTGSAQYGVDAFFTKEMATVEERRRALQRTAVLVGIIAAMGLLQGGNSSSELTITVLNELEKIELHEKDRCGKNPRVSERLYWSIYKNYRDAHAEGTSSINPHEARFHGDFGRAAFAFDNSIPEYLERKMNALKEVIEELSADWKLETPTS